MPTSIFNLPSPLSTSPPPKIHLTHSSISSKYLVPTQPPTKTNPFQQINEIPFARDLRICVPVRVWESLYRGNDSISSSSSESSANSLPILKYSKVSMTLKDILDKEDLRRGNYLFLSTPSSSATTDTTDTMISLSRGTLTITMPQNIYQHSGLTFPTTKVPTGSRKHDPRAAKYRVELDLRSPSMVRGKKGFDRIMYAAKYVEGLTEKRQWWVYDYGDCGDSSVNTKKRKRGVDGLGNQGEGQAQVNVDETVDTEDENSLSKFNPTVRTTGGIRTTFKDVLIPSFMRNPSFFSSIPARVTTQQLQRGGIPTILEEDIYDIVEYLSLVFHQSPRIVKSQYGQIDSYLCQYVLPDVSSSSLIAKNKAEDISEEGGTGASSEDLIIVSYSGFIPSVFVMQVLVDLLRRSRSTNMTDKDSEEWASLNIVAHPSEVTSSSDGLMIVLQSNSQVADKQQAEVGTDDTRGTIPAEDETGPPNGNKAESNHSPSRGFRYATCFEFVDHMTG